MGVVQRRICAIANPKAGVRGAQDVIEQGSALLAKAGTQLEVHWTNAAGHATEIAADLTVEAVDAICAVGGDGTAFEVIQGLFQPDVAKRPKLAYVPAGSGNSVALDLGCADPAVAWESVATQDERSIDVAEVTIDGKVWFAANVLAWGAGARMNAKAERMRWAGRSRYDLAAVREIFAPRLASAGARIDGVEDKNLLLGVASLTRHSGRGMCVAPMAELDDGELDLVTIAKGSRLGLAKLLSKIYTGDHVHSPLVTCTRHREIRIDLDPGSDLVIDGELMPAQQVQVRMLQKALEVYAPQP